MYKSKFETRVAEALGSKVSLGYSFGYETDKFEYTLVKHYTPDWPIVRPDGTKAYIETKGNFDLDSRQKMAAIRKQYSDVTFYLLFMQDNFIRKSSGYRYSDWAKKHNFEYSVGFIPYVWLLGSHTPDTLINKGIVVTDGK